MDLIINQLNSAINKNMFLSKDINGREINFYKLNNVFSTGVNLIYPNLLLFCNDNKTLYKPIDEKILSLQKLNNNTYFNFKPPIKNFKKVSTPVFFFCYNTDNYYHFIYDTLPYLITYIFLKKQIPNIKLLMTYPNKDSNNFYQFVTEFLNILGIFNDDIILVDKNTLYQTVYVSDSYTHGIDSNLPPRDEIYKFYKQITKKIKTTNNSYPKNIYISRRTWLHNDFSNIGTNYTSRRKLINENELVEFLKSKNYVEVFTEKLTTIDKIAMFANAKNIIGSIGGGLCNVLFSSKNCNLISINSPCFLDINKRFEHSFKTVNYTPFNYTKHSTNDKFKLYMRVKANNVVGEIVEIGKKTLAISYTTTPVAGWNSNSTFKTEVFDKKICEPLDPGLNSPWYVDIEKLKKII